MSKKNKERLPHQTTAVGVKESVGDHIFNIINTILMIVICLVILLSPVVRDRGLFHRPEDY